MAQRCAEAVMDGSAVAVFGRDEELARLTDLLAGAWPVVVRVDGQPGIGKTTVWQAAVAGVRANGARVLAFRPGEAEQTMAFAGLSGLLPASVLDPVLDDVPSPRRRALETALRRVDGPPAAADPAVIGLGVLSALLALADRPMLLAIDDAQWLDPSSRAALDFAVRRLDVAPVAALVAARTGSTVTLETALPVDRRFSVHVGPMGHVSIGRLIHARLGVRPPRPVLVRLAEAAAGNPFVALELARGLPRSGESPPGVPFGATTDPRQLVGARINQLSPAAADVLRVVAAAGRPTEDLLTALLGAAVAESAVDELIRADLATIEDGAVLPTHPLIGSAAYGLMLPAQRRRLHKRLSGLVTDPEAAARHLALSLTGPDEAAARVLDDAAAHAQRRGATAAASDLAELAVRATDPAAVATRLLRELTLANHLMEAGAPDQAQAVLIGAMARIPPGPQRVPALCALTDMAIARSEHAAARRWYTQAVTEAGDDPLAAAQAHVTAGMSAWFDIDRQRTHSVAATAALVGRETEAPDSAATALILLASIECQAGHGFAADLVDRAVALEPATRLPPMKRPSIQRAVLIGVAGRPIEAIDAIGACLAESVRAGEWPVQPHLLRCLAQNEYAAGRLDAAGRHIAQAMELAEELGLTDSVLLAVAATIAAASGRTDQARDHGRDALARARETGSDGVVAVALGAIGLSHLLGGDPVAAADALAAAHEIRSASGIVEPAWWRLDGDLVEALLGAGRVAEAGDVAKALGRQAESSRNPWSLLVAGRCGGLTAVAAGRYDEALTAVEGTLAQEHLAELGLEWARTRLVLGVILRRAGRKRAAGQTLRDAAERLSAIGAHPWARQARQELDAIGGRTAAGDELTTMEDRVARLAADGRTNREIADALYLSVRTVETHLSAAYRKLGVRSRTQLAVRLRWTD